MRIMAGLFAYIGDFMTQAVRIKPFKTYEEQLALLKQRGMRIPDDKKAIEILRTDNYYRISGYWLTMLKKNPDGSESFYPGTSFDDVIDLYRFDTELRNVIMAATITVETNLKAFVAYYHGQKYGPCGYMNNDTSEDVWNHAQFVNALSTDLKRRKEELFVIHHKEKMGGVYPIWVATELCSFDQISKFYRNMLPADRSAIAKTYYGIPSREYIESWLHCAVVARNMAAHGARFYNKPSFKPAVMLPKHFSQYANSLFGYLYAIFQLLPCGEKNVFLNSVGQVIEKHPFVLIKHLGLPNNWKTLITQGAKAKVVPLYPNEVRADVDRYLGYKWEWRVIATMINRVHGYNLSGEQLKSLHEQNGKNTTSSTSKE